MLIRLLFIAKMPGTAFFETVGISQVLGSRKLHAWGKDELDQLNDNVDRRKSNSDLLNPICFPV